MDEVTIKIDPDSSRLSDWMHFATGIIKEKTGISPGTKVTSLDQMKAIITAWMEQVVPTIHSKASNYEKRRDEIVRQHNLEPSLTDILDEKAAVCSEVSIFGHLVLAEYGLETRIVTGEIERFSGSVGHAWLQLYERGQPTLIFDSNNRHVFPRMEQFKEFWGGGVP